MTWREQYVPGSTAGDEGFCARDMETSPKDSEGAFLGCSAFTSDARVSSPSARLANTQGLTPRRLTRVSRVMCCTKVVS